MQKKIALITGMSGFIGQHLKKELEENGYSVFGLSRNSETSQNQTFQCDVRDRDKVFAIIKENKFDYIFHLAGAVPLALGQASRELAYDVNVNGTVNFLDALVEYSSQTKILIVSSYYVYGDPKYSPVDEKHPLLGTGLYSESKRSQEERALPYKDRLKLIIVRSFNHTGPGQDKLYVIPKIINSIIKIKRGEQKTLVMGSPDVLRDFTDVRDVVRAYRLLLEQEQFGFICNVCRGESIKLQEVVDYVAGKAGVNDLKIEINQAFVRPDEPKEIRGDNSLLKKIISWEPAISYQQMLSDMYDYYNTL